MDVGTSVEYHDGPARAAGAAAAVTATAPINGRPTELPPGLLEAWVRITLKLRVLQASYGPRLEQARRMGDDAAFARLRTEADAAAAAFLAGEPWAASDLALVPAALEADPQLAAEAGRIARRLAAELGLPDAVTAPPRAARPSAATPGAVATPTGPVVP